MLLAHGYYVNILGGLNVIFLSVQQRLCRPGGILCIVLNGYIEHERGDWQLEIKGDNLLSIYESYLMQDILHINLLRHKNPKKLL